MRANIPGRYAALALLFGGLACAHNKVETDEGSVVAQDSTKAKNDTSAYKGQERDTMAVPTPAPTDTTQAAPTPAPTPADTTQYQPQAAPAPAPSPTDTTSSVPQQTPTDTSAAAQPTSPAPTPAPAPGADSSSGWSKDTTKSQ